MESKFTGSLLELIIVNIAAGLVSAFSLGLLIPWATCYRYRYLASHTIIDGNQLRFDGTAAQLWVNGSNGSFSSLLQSESTGSGSAYA